MKRSVTRDFGPTVRLGRQEVVGEFRDDPAAFPQTRLVYGARVRDPLRTLAKTGQISRAQWLAVERLRDDAASAASAGAGARPPDPLRAGGHGGSGGHWHGDRRLDGLARYRAAWARLEAAGFALIVHDVVVEGRSLDDCARQRRCRFEVARSLLHRGLDVLTECYATDTGDQR